MPVTNLDRTAKHETARVMAGVLDAQARAQLQQAVECLRRESWLVKLSGTVGTSLAVSAKFLPNGAKEKVRELASAAITKAMNGAALTLAHEPGAKASTGTGKLLTAASGAVGGAFGIVGAVAEIPATTLLTLRAIADVARSEGFDVRSPAVRLECAQVLALGSDDAIDDDALEGYYAVRSGMAMACNQAAAQLASGAAQMNWLAKVIQIVLEKFGVQLTSKAAAMSVPVVGAVIGATINTLFTDYYQTIARGHFIVKRLEDAHGVHVVRAELQAICAERAERLARGRRVV
jgi:hypothetical protein